MVVAMVWRLVEGGPNTYMMRLLWAAAVLTCMKMLAFAYAAYFKTAYWPFIIILSDV